MWAPWMGPGYSVVSPQPASKHMSSGQQPPDTFLRLKRDGRCLVPLGYCFIRLLHFSHNRAILGFFLLFASHLRDMDVHLWRNPGHLFSSRSQPPGSVTSCQMTTLFQLLWGLMAESKSSPQGRCYLQQLSKLSTSNHEACLPG